MSNPIPLSRISLLALSQVLFLSQSFVHSHTRGHSGGIKDSRLRGSPIKQEFPICEGWGKSRILGSRSIPWSIIEKRLSNLCIAVSTCQVAR